MKRILKYTALFLLTAFALLNIVLGYYGVSSIFLTITIYALVWCAGVLVIQQILKNAATAKNFKLAFTTLLLSLFIGELCLKYIFKTNLSKQEINGSFYSFPYGKPQPENFIRKYVLKQHDTRLINYAAHTHEIRGRDEFQYLHHYNALGLRGAEPSLDSNKINWVILGDSFTEGSGAPEDSTWTVLLQNELNKNATDTLHPFQCISGGISGSELFSEHLILKELLLHYKPQRVIVAINQTDIDDVVKGGG